MDTTFNISDILYLPFKDAAARKNFIYLSLAILAGSIIPIIPTIIAMGYVYQIMAAMIRDNREPHLPEWTDLGKLLTDGFKLFIVRLVFMLPVILPFMVLFLGFMFAPLFAFSTSNSDADMGLIMATLFLPFLCMIPIWLLGMLVGILLMPASCHMVARDEISAAFRFKEWWPVFRSNLGQFLLVLVVIWAVSMVTTIAMQIIILTILLSVLILVIAPALSAYMMIVQGMLEAMAYRNGVVKAQGS